MDTAEGTGPSTYDGFISYSHAADDLLAPRLQSALQRFAKPWWKRRAVRIFRDESSLSANPHLWSSITEALDASGWFVLLLSPDAAESEWVNQEIGYWVENRDPKKILPVVTDGTFVWDDDVMTGSAVPDALEGVFSEEPRWVDMRWAKGEEQLDLQNPRFADAIADIGSAIREVPKDELSSEEVRQHRRTVRTAWAAGGLVTLLGVVAAWAGFLASQNAAEAEANADEAQRQATIAAEQADIAEANAEAEAAARTEADANAAEAQANSERADREAETAREAEALAKARELATAAVGTIEEDPELSTLLALEAIRAAPNDDLPPELENALWTAGSTNRLLDVFEAPALSFVSLSLDGQTLALSPGPGRVDGLDAFTGAVLWSYEEETNDKYTYSEFSPDGRVAQGVIEAQSEDEAAESDGLPNRVLILDGATGDELHRLEFPDCEEVELPKWSPDGSLLVVSSGQNGCEREVAGEVAQFWFEVFDTATWESVAVIPLTSEVAGPLARWDGSGGLYAMRAYEEILAFAPETFEPLPPSGATGMGDVTPSGDRYVSFYAEGQGGDDFSAYVFDAETGTSRHVIYNENTWISLPEGLTITEDERYAIVGSIARYTYVYDLETYQEATRLPTNELWSNAYDPATGRLYTTSTLPGVRVWDLTPGAVGVQTTIELGDYPWVNGDTFFLGDGIVGMNTISFEVGWASQAFDPATGERVGEPLTADTAIQIPVAGSRFVVQPFGEPSARLWNPADGSLLDLMTCSEVSEDSFGDPYCSGPGEPNWYWYVAPDDANEIWAFGSALPFDWETFGDVHILDPTTGEVLRSALVDDWEGMHPSINPRAVRFVTPDWTVGRGPNGLAVHDRETGEVLHSALDGEKLQVSPSRRLIAYQQPTRIAVVETDSWTEVTSFSFSGRARGLAFNHDETRLGIGAIETAFVLDIESGLVVQRVNLPGVSDFHWIDDETAIVGTNDGVFGKLTLSTDDFLAKTREGLLRTFTDRECATYRIDPCPTLDEMRGR
jgi:WD40 repeat protein